MQADGWLVEHIEHAGQSGADLAGEADALALAAGQGARAARQIEIVEPDVDEEAQAVVDFLQNTPSDLQVFLGEAVFEGGEPVARGADREARHLGDVHAVDLHRQRFRLEAGAVADFARALGLVAAELFADPGGIGLAPAAFEVGQHAFEGLVDLVLAGVVVVDELELLALGAVQHDLARGLVQLPPRLVHRELEVPRQGLERLGVKRGGAFRPRRDRALVQGLVLVRHDEVRVEAELDAEAVAGRAGAGGIVEREQARLDLGDGEAGDGAGELLGKDEALRLLAFGRVRPFRDGDAVGEAQGLFQAVGVAGIETGFED